MLRAFVEAFADDRLTGTVDIGGPSVLSYSRLLGEASRASGLVRLRVPTVPVPASLVSLATAALSAAPFWTVAALIESLQGRHGLPDGAHLGPRRRQAPARGA